jgi:hypothetical protein
MPEDHHQSAPFSLAAPSLVVMRNAAPDRSGVAPSVTVTMRNTGVAVGAQAAFAVIIGAGLAGRFAAEAGFTRAFAMGAIAAGATLGVAAFLPSRRYPATPPARTLPASR